MVGNKSAEISITHTDELVLGLAFSETDSKVMEYRANATKMNKYEFHSNYTPAVFLLLGGDFDYLSMIGKLGAAYVNQSINGVVDDEKLYLAAGFAIDVDLNEYLGARASFDNVSGALIGVTFNFR